MPDKSLTVEEALSLLVATPKRISALTKGLSPAQLRATPDADEWSANAVLAHLRSCADVWGTSIATILAEDMSTIRAINPRAWIRKTDYLELEFKPSLQAFTDQRADLLAVLQPLPMEAWSRAAIVKGAGKPREKTVLDYVDRMARHERVHAAQIERIVNSFASMEG